MLCTLTFSSLLLVSNAFASHHYSKRLHRPSENEIDNNLQDSLDISASASSTYGASFPHQRDSYIPPAPFAKQHQHSRTPLYGPTNKRLRQEKLSLDDKADFTGASSVGYILTAGGREKIYDGEGETKIAPHATPFASSPFAKKFAFDKSFKKYRFAYNLGANSPIVVNPTGGSSSTLTTPAIPDDREPTDVATAGTAAPDTVISRTYNALNTAAPNSGSPSAHHKFYTEKTDLYGSKGTVWKQLGPNVEISSAAEHIPFTRQVSPSKERKKSKASSQQRKTGPKNLRTGFMTTQQHALYVANNVKGFKGGANFDHSNVLRQSDKFELTDAMISEAEKEEALKNTKALRIRFKQEVPASQGQPIPFQSVDQYDASPQSIQYYSQANAPFSLVAAHGVPLALNSFTPQLGSLGKGFVRHIELEMSGAGGARKMVPALIIPLGPEAAANYVNSEVAAAPPSVFVNQPDRPAKPAFPYDIVAPRYVHHPDAINTIASSATAENYHLQPFAQLHYQYKTQLGDESSYNPYASPHYHNHNLYNTRFAFINSNGGGGATTVPSNVETTNGGTTLATHDKRPSRYSSSYSGAHAHQSAKKSAQHLAAEPSEQKPVTLPPSVTSIATFIYDADNAAAGTAHAYLAPSESSYFATMASTRDETRSSSSRHSGTKHFEKNDVRRDK